MKNFIKHIFGGKFKREISELYASMAIRRLAISMIAIFEPVFIYKLFGSLQSVICYYAIVYTFYFFLLPIGGKIASWYGFEHAILYSVPIVIIYFLMLFNMPQFPYLLFYGAAFFLAIYKILFWPAYHSSMAHYGNSKNRGGEISGLIAVSNLVGIIGPLLGGIIITCFGFKVLFVVVAILFFASAIPLFTTLEKFQRSHLSYWKTFRRIIKPYASYKRKDQLAHFGSAEEFSVMVLWPMYIFLMVGSISKMGTIVTCSLLLASLAALYIGKLSNRKEPRVKIIKMSAIINSIVWFVKPFMSALGGIFAIDVVSRNLYNFIWIPFCSEIYNKGRERGFLKYSLFFEMNLCLAKAVFAWILVIILCFTRSWMILFGLTGIASLLYLNVT